MRPVIVSIHELFVGVEALGSQPDLNLGEEMTVRKVIENHQVEELD
jgi:hypothetical protein